MENCKRLLKSHSSLEESSRRQREEKSIQIRKDKRFDKTLEHRRKVRRCIPLVFHDGIMIFFLLLQCQRSEVEEEHDVGSTGIRKRV